jgi:hypothetical protein
MALNFSAIAFGASCIEANYESSLDTDQTTRKPRPLFPKIIGVVETLLPTRSRGGYYLCHGLLGTSYPTLGELEVCRARLMKLLQSGSQQASM